MIIVKYAVYQSKCNANHTDYRFIFAKILMHTITSHFYYIAPPTKPCRQYLLKIKFLCVFLLTIR